MTNSKILQQASSLVFLCLLCYITTNAQNKYSGEELFRTVYFGQGSFAGSVTELQGMSIENFTTDAQEVSEAYQLQDQVVAPIKAEKPTFLKQFSNDLYSGNHMKIRSQLQNGKSTLYWASTQLGETRNPELETDLIASVTEELGGCRKAHPDTLQLKSIILDWETKVQSNAPCLIGEVVYGEVYATITLGNPKQRCRFSGICRVENWVPDTPSFSLKVNQYIVKMLSFCKEQKYLDVLFLNKFLSPSQINTYFNNYFMIESPYKLTEANYDLLRIRKCKTFFVCKGQYLCISEGYDIKIRFNIQFV